MPNTNRREARDYGGIVQARRRQGAKPDSHAQEGGRNHPRSRGRLLCRWSILFSARKNDVDQTGLKGGKLTYSQELWRAVAGGVEIHMTSLVYAIPLGMIWSGAL